MLSCPSISWNSAASYSRRAEREFYRARQALPFVRELQQAGDTAALSNSPLPSAMPICQRFTGNDSGAELPLAPRWPGRKRRHRATV